MSEFSLSKINDRISKESEFIEPLRKSIDEVIVGQDELINKILIGLLANGHLLLEGVPGLAKTLTVNTLSQAIDTGFQRVQFTPDMLPADLLGTLIFNQKTGAFETRKGPIFSNIILADEINRAPSKVQSALLEAMQERQVTIGEGTFKLDPPFLVLATQNPIEQEGTYPLPVKPKQILDAQKTINDIYVDEKVEDYILNLVFATRNPDEYGLGDLSQLIEYGASPRATINLILASRARAFLEHRGYITPEDVRYIGKDVLRHRVILTYEAEAEELTSEDIIQRLFDSIEIP